MHTLRPYIIINMFKPEIEFQPREVIKAFQEEKLHEDLQYLKAHSKFYQNLFSKNHIDISKIKTLEDLRKSVTIDTNEAFKQIQKDGFYNPSF